MARKTFGPGEISDLCEEARRHNQRDEVTGVLVTRPGRFLQALEGPKEAVEDAFLRIVRDDRHHDLMLLSRRVTTRREFGEWEMAYCEGAAEVDEIVARVARLTDGAPEPIQKAFSDFLNTAVP